MFHSFFPSTDFENFWTDFTIWSKDRDLIWNELQRPDQFKLRLEMPGTKRENISVKFAGDVLQIDYVDYSARKKHCQYYLDHREYDHAKITCKYEDGILSVDVPNRAQQDKETSVEVK